MTRTVPAKVPSGLLADCDWPELPAHPATGYTEGSASSWAVKLVGALECYAGRLAGIRKLVTPE